MTTPEQRSIARSVVQIGLLGTGWPGADDAAWDVDLALEPVYAVDAIGGRWGEAIIVQRYGATTDSVGDPAALSVERSSYAGRFVRILVADSAGTITPIPGDPTTYVADWHGWISDAELEPDGSSAEAGGRLRLRCQDLAAYLDRIWCHHAMALPPGGSSLWENLAPIETVPPVNPGGAGNISTSADPDSGNTLMVWGGTTLATVGTVLAWALRYAARRPTGTWGPTTPDWTLSTTLASSSLTSANAPSDYQLLGKSVAQVLTELAGPATGHIWRVQVIDGDPWVQIVNVSSATATAGGQTVAASSAISVTLHDTPWVHGLQLSLRPRRYDQVVVTGDRPWTVAQLGYDPASPSTATIAPVVATSTEPPTEDSSLDWRAWQIDGDWDGSAFCGDGTDGIRNGLITTGATAAQREFSAALAVTPAMLELTADHPGTATTGPMPGMVYVGSSIASTDWIAYPMPIEVRLGSTRIIIGGNADDAAILHSAVTVGKLVVVQIGAYEPAPLRFEVSVEESTWPTPGSPRVAHIALPGYGEERRPANTIEGITSAGALDFTTGTTTTRTAFLRQGLAAAAHLLGSSGSARWHEKGRLVSGYASADLPPGRRISTLTCGRAYNLQAIVVERRRTYTSRGYGTSWHAEPPDPAATAAP